MARLSQALDAILVGRGIERRVNRALAAVGGPAVTVARTSADLERFTMELRKEGGGIVMRCNLARVREDAGLRGQFYGRTPALARLFWQTDADVRACLASVDDDSGNVVGFCSANPDAILVPDEEFQRSNGYAAMRAVGAAPPAAWRERSDTLVWRGATTGQGRISAPDMSATNAALIQRTRLCLALKDETGADARFVAISQSTSHDRDRKRLREAGLLGDRRPAESWIGDKFALDIDGNTNAWSNLFQRLLLGCCVIKVASPFGFRQWYYEDLVPGRHFVAVAADLSDLRDQLAWCRTHLDECQAIAAEGQKLAQAMTFETEMARGVATLNRRLPRD